jgi:hypothetical protein
MHPRCRGAVILTGPSSEFGRSDLLMRGGRTRRVEVSLSPPGAAYVRRHRRVTNVYATVLLTHPDTLSTSEPLTILAPRRR